MAGKKTSGALVRMSTPRAAAPVIRVVTTPRAPAKGKGKSKRRHHAGGGGSIVGIAMAGAIVGFAEKSNLAIPEIPGLGFAGTLAVALHFFGPKGKMMRELAFAAAAIAGRDVGATGQLLQSTQAHTSPTATHGHRAAGVASQI